MHQRQKLQKPSATLYKYNQLHKHILFNIQKYQSHQLTSYRVLLPTAKQDKAFTHDTALLKKTIETITEILLDLMVFMGILLVVMGIIVVSVGLY